MDETKKVKTFFEGYVEGFDSLYETDKRTNFTNRVLRASFYKRLNMAIEDADGLDEGFSILDIGTGTGRYLQYLAPRAGKLTGIDMSTTMLDFAQDTAQKGGFIDRTELINGDFLKHQFSTKYDMVIALGYFDYIYRPALHLEKMIDIAETLVIASFPKRWHLLTPQRAIRYKLKNCPLRHYTANDIRSYIDIDKQNKMEIIDIGREFYLRYHK